jgi:hypothetical protein
MPDTKKRKPHFLNSLKEFSKEYDGSDLNKLNDSQRSIKMTRFYVTQILNTINPGLLPDDPDDLDESFTDGTNDAGCDFFYRSEGRVTIIQTKYHGRSGRTNDDEADFEHFMKVLNRLHPTWGKGSKKHERLQGLIAEIDWDNDQFDLQFITTGRSNDPIRDREKEGHDLIKGIPDFQERVDVEFLDETNLNEKLREALSASQGIDGEVDVLFSALDSQEPWLMHESSGDKESYIGCINAAQLHELFKKHKYKLLSMNIRNYVGDTATNKGIIETVKNDPDNFFFFNNGISAVATQIEPDRTNRILKCKNLSIINGGQTLKSVSKGFQKSPDNAKQATVLFRVSKISFSRKEAEKDFIEKITRYNNTQNAIRVSDFMSNHQTQIDMAKHFKNSPARGGKKFWYKNKRTGDRDSNKISIAMDEFTKTIHAFEFGPADFFGGQAYLFDLNKGYAKVFGDDGQVWESVTKNDFHRLAGTWFLCEQSRSLFKSRSQELLKEEKEMIEKTEDMKPMIKNALERRWLFFFALGVIFRKIHKKDVSIKVLEHMAKPQWWEDSSDPVSDYVEEACEILITTYLTASQQPDFVHRNWFRSTTTLTAIEMNVSRSPALVRRLKPIPY